MKYNNVNIKGTGSYLPSDILTNDDITIDLNTTSKWVEEKLGIKERRVVSLELPSEMAYHASMEALKDAGIHKEDLDLIIVVTSSPEQLSPSTACKLNNFLKLEKNIPSFDINAVCAGFVYAMSIAGPLIETCTYENILIVATEAYSTITDYEDRNAIFFGDGAGAVILGKSKGGYMSAEIKANGGGSGMTGFSLKHGEKYTTIPKQVWDQAIEVLPPSIEEILDNNDMDVNDIDLFIPHQASINMLKLIAEKVNLPVDKLKTVMEKYGNIAGASIPIVLDEVKKSGELKYGDNILMTAIGSGWAWGSLIINYER